MRAGLFTRAAWALLAGLLTAISAGGALGQTKPPKTGGKDHKLFEELLASAKPSSAVKEGWFVSGPTYDVHSTISKEYAAMAALHLDKFHRRFSSIFREPFKDTRKPVAYGFATQAEYLKFSPGSKGSQGRFMVAPEGETTKKDLAWFSTPPGEKDFYLTDYGVVQHEATHQLLDAYTDNPGIPDWFDEGCASFFESWDLDKTNDENILSGIEDRYGMRVCLSYSKQEPAPPLAEHWIAPQQVLGLEKFESFELGFGKWPPGPEEEAAARKAQIVVQQQYSQSWCAVTFIIANEGGRRAFTRLVGAFRENRHFSHIRSEFYTEGFLSSFEKEWVKFIEKKVLRKWELPTVGGKKLRVGDGRAPPAEAAGFPLTADRRGDLYLVEAEAGNVPAAYGKETWWMLKAWGVPVRLYNEAWKEVPRLIARKEYTPLIASAYALVPAPGGADSERVFVLIPLWLPSLSSEFPSVLEEAARKLIARAKEAKAKEEKAEKEKTAKEKKTEPGKAPAAAKKTAPGK